MNETQNQVVPWLGDNSSMISSGLTGWNDMLALLHYSDLTLTDSRQLLKTALFWTVLVWLPCTPLWQSYVTVNCAFRNDSLLLSLLLLCLLLSDDRVWRLSACLSHTSGLRREQRPRKTKIGTEVAHITHDSDTTFKVKTSKVKVTRPLRLAVQVTT